MDFCGVRREDEGMNRANKFTQQYAEEICAALGLEYLGVQQGFGSVPDQMLANDPVTRSTIAVRVPELSLERTKEILAAGRARFTSAPLAGQRGPSR
jgi:hypothetical protein